MQETWRWFGPEDPITLENIVQAGASGVVTSLHHVPTGDAWSLAELEVRKAEIEAAGLKWSVVESIPLHNDLKTRSGDYQQLIQNYQESIRNVGAVGVEVVCYNFMPVVDWTRTNLDYELPNASRALRFEMTDFAAYDIHMLQRENDVLKANFEDLQKDRRNESFLYGGLTVFLGAILVVLIPKLRGRKRFSEWQ